MEWVRVFRKISEWLVTQEDNQEELVKILYTDLDITQGMIDHQTEGDDGSLMNEIDPFTFLRLILKFQTNYNKTEKLTALLQIIDEDFPFPEEMDYNGVPSVLPLAARMSGYSYERGVEATNDLWKLFIQASNNEIENNLFIRVLNIRKIAPKKLTQSLFCAFPDSFLPIDNVTIPWLRYKNIPIPEDNENNYQNFLEKYKECMLTLTVNQRTSNMPFYEISHQAFLRNNDENETGEGDNTDDNNDDLNTILYGPPGTGKTYSTREKAVRIIDPESCKAIKLYTEKGRNELKIKYDEFVKDGQIVFTTFHQSFSYEDFIQGISAELDEKGDLHYTVKSGIFKKLCEKADKDSDKKKYVLIIDEINRGNISKIFGELITLLEKDKRKGAEEELSVKLPYSNDEDNPFSVPKNVYVIGTMNTADKSLANIDLALRRRFDFEEMPPKYDLLINKEVEGINIGQLLRTINQRIEVLIDRDHLIGHSYMLGIDSVNGLKKVFEKNIIPLLQEYFYDDWKRIRWVLNDHRKIGRSDLQFIIEGGEGEQSVVDLFGKDIEGEVSDRRFYINQEAFGNIESYTGILNNND
jgi:hypothetical protein